MKLDHRDRALYLLDRWRHAISEDSNKTQAEAIMGAIARTMDAKDVRKRYRTKVARDYGGGPIAALHAKGGVRTDHVFEFLWDWKWALELGNRTKAAGILVTIVALMDECKTADAYQSQRFRDEATGDVVLSAIERAWRGAGLRHDS